VGKVERPRKLLRYTLFAIPILVVANNACYPPFSYQWVALAPGKAALEGAVCSGLRSTEDPEPLFCRFGAWVHGVELNPPPDYFEGVKVDWNGQANCSYAYRCKGSKLDISQSPDGGGQLALDGKDVSAWLFRDVTRLDMVLVEKYVFWSGKLVQTEVRQNVAGTWVSAPPPPDAAAAKARVAELLTELRSCLGLTGPLETCERWRWP
jgi:hypothetical protein